MQTREASLLWQKAHEFALDIYRATERFPAHERYGLVNQMRCAAVAIPASITESLEHTCVRERAAAMAAGVRAVARVIYHLELSRELGYLSLAEMGTLQGTAEALGLLLDSAVAAPIQESRDETLAAC